MHNYLGLNTPVTWNIFLIKVAQKRDKKVDKERAASAFCF